MALKENRVGMARRHSEDAAAALLFVRRRLGSRLGGALTGDAGAIGWIVEACKEKSVHNDGRGRETPEHQAEPRSGKQPRCEGLQVASLVARQE